MKGTLHSIFAMNPSKADKRKITALWPLELNDLIAISYNDHAQA